MDLSDQRTQIILVIVLAALGGIYAWFTYIYGPKNEEIVELQDQIEVFEQDIARFQITADKADEAAAALEVARQEWAAILTQFPTSMKEEEVLANMTAAEQMSRLYLFNFTRGPRRTRELYIEQDYLITLMGEYRRVGRYIAELASMPRRMAVSRMQVTHPSAFEGGTVGGEAGPVPGDEEVVIRLTVTSYIVRER